MHGIVYRIFTTYMTIYGIDIRFWPTLRKSDKVGTEWFRVMSRVRIADVMI
jgi:hypothetical protein